jgi:hypothetical protein
MKKCYTDEMTPPNTPRIPETQNTLRTDVREATRWGLATLAASVVAPGIAIVIPAAYAAKKMTQPIRSRKYE